MSLLQSLRQKYKKDNSLISGSDIPPIERIRTNIAGLDILLGGGMPCGRIVELAGPESTGKSSFSLACSQEFISQGYPVFYSDLERTVTDMHIKTYGLDRTDDFVYQRPDYGEQCLDMCLSAVEEGAKLVIIDSVAMLMPKDLIEKVEDNPDGSKGFMGTSIPKLLNDFRVNIVNTLERHGACLLLVNQLRDKVNSPYGGTKTAGGWFTRYQPSVKLLISHAIKDKATPGLITSHIKTEKNKTSIAGLSTEIKILNGVILKSVSLLTEAKNAGIVKGSGAWFELPEEICDKYHIKGKLGAGLIKAAEILMREHPAAYDEIYETLINTYKPKTDAEKEEELQEELGEVID